MSQLWSLTASPPVFGNLMILAFLVVQGLDGVLTYVGVITFGAGVEANPLIRWLMAAMGHGPGLASAKFVAGTFGIALHLVAVHRMVAALTALYLGVAIVPWLAILFLY